MASKKNLQPNQNVDELHLSEKDADEMEIDLVELMYRLIEKLKWIIAAGLIGMIAMGLFTKFCITPEYQATSKLYVMEAQDQIVSLNALNMSEKLAADYVQVFNNWHVHENVINTLNLPYTYSQIEDMLSVSIPSGTRIIKITVTSEDPQEAYDIAMAYAQIAPAFIEAKMETNRPNIFEEARVPTEPSAPSMFMNVFMGGFLAAAVAVVAIFIQFVSDDRVRNAEMLQKRLGLATLGMMPVQENSERSVKRSNGKSGKKGAKA